MLRLVLLLACLAASVAAQPAAAPRVAPAVAGTAVADSAMADTLAAVPVRPRTALDAALARVASVRLPRGAFPALGPQLAGVVWTQPESRAQAVRDLADMRAAGVRAVRTEIVADTLLLAVASRLGIALWQDLPVVGRPAAFLMRGLPDAEAVLREAVARGRRYPAARHYGLLRASDTSDRAARPYVERLAAIVREAGAESYYLTRFPDSDRCAALVDVVLLDARDADPVAMLARWRARAAATGGDTPAGLGSVGTGVRPGREGGWRTAGTEAAQARALEDAMVALLTLSEPPAATFVYRWRDAGPDADRRLRGAEVTGLRYGLRADDGTPREALAVATGFFTGRQRVFAVDAGRAVGEMRVGSPLLLLGWGLALMLGLFVAGAPKLSALAPRYFGRRDLYREAVARGYDLSTGETAGLAAVLVGVVGVVLASTLRALARTDALTAATSAWSPEAQARLADLVGRPFALVAVVALAYAAWLLFVLLWLNVVSGRRRLRPAQALSLTVWSRWMWFPLMALALVLAGVSPQAATLLAPAVLGLGVLVETVACYRSMLDLVVVANVSPPRALLVGFGIPFALAVAALVWLGVTAQAETTFLWHLATRS